MPENINLWWKRNKKSIFLWYIQMDYFRNIGAGWISAFYGWISLATLKDAVLVGGIAKLTFLKGLPMWWLIGIVFILGIAMELFKIFLGWITFTRGFSKTANEWSQKHANNSPFNQELRKTMENIAQKVGAKSEFTNL